MATSQVTSTNTQGPVTIAYVKPMANTQGLNPSPPSMNATVTSTPNQCYKVKAARITGAIQITCALASLISGVVILLLATCTVGDVDACSNYNQGYFDEWYSTFPAVIAWPIWGAVCVSCHPQGRDGGGGGCGSLNKYYYATCARRGREIKSYVTYYIGI